MSTVPIDNGYRIEVRAESPDPSLPSSGELLAYAQRAPGGSWTVHRRGDSEPVVVPTKVQASLALLRLVDEQPGDDVPWTVLPDGSVHFHGFADNPVVDELERALRVLGVESGDQAYALLIASPAHVTAREIQAAAARFPYGTDEPHAHMPPAGGIPRPQAGERHQCRVCGVQLEWARHADRDQYGWKVVAP